MTKLIHIRHSEQIDVADTSSVFLISPNEPTSVVEGKILSNKYTNTTVIIECKSLPI